MGIADQKAVSQAKVSGLQPVHGLVDVLEDMIIDGNFIHFVIYFFEHQKNNSVDFFKNKFKITLIVSKATFHFFYSSHFSGGKRAQEKSDRQEKAGKDDQG